jgi:hypothetical protein
MLRPGAQLAHDMLDRSHRLAAQIDAGGFPLAAFETLQKWQQDRLARTYDDLMRRERYRPACIFFLEELYGGLDFRERDEDVGKVMPVMVRFLPDRVLRSMAEAFELQALSLDLDMEMATILDRRGMGELTLEHYAETYRETGRKVERERQILLIRKLVQDLARLVDRSFVKYLVRLMRGPAHAAGFGNLQSFLENGLNAFLSLEDRDYFALTIFEREWQAMQNLFAGNKDPYGL